MPNFEEVRYIQATWHPSNSEWDLQEVLQGSPYETKDIKEVWVKWNHLYVEMNDGIILEKEGPCIYQDLKYPLEVEFIDEDYQEVDTHKEGE